MRFAVDIRLCSVADNLDIDCMDVDKDVDTRLVDKRKEMGAFNNNAKDPVAKSGNNDNDDSESCTSHHPSTDDEEEGDELDPGHTTLDVRRRRFDRTKRGWVRDAEEPVLWSYMAVWLSYTNRKDALPFLVRTLMMAFNERADGFDYSDENYFEAMTSEHRLHYDFWAHVSFFAHHIERSSFDRAPFSN
jgi:hypothetical protein